MLTVQKRNGRIEPLDISKIQKYTSSAVKGLDNVSQSELEVDAKIQFRDKITTEEIQKTLIKTAVDKIDIDRPNWTYVAARLFLYDLYHKVNAYTGYGSFAEYLEPFPAASHPFKCQNNRDSFLVHLVMQDC